MQYVYQRSMLNIHYQYRRLYMNIGNAKGDCNKCLKICKINIHDKNYVYLFIMMFDLLA